MPTRRPGPPTHAAAQSTQGDGRCMGNATSTSTSQAPRNANHGPCVSWTRSPNGPSSPNPTSVPSARKSSAGRASIVGTPEEVVEIVRRYELSRCDELIIPCWTLGDRSQCLETLELFSQEVAQHFPS